MKTICYLFLTLASQISYGLILQPIVIVGVVKSFDESVVILQQDRNLLRVEKKYFKIKDFKSGEMAIATWIKLALIK